MHCANCGHKLEDAWTACPICGARVGGGADPRAVAAGDLSQTSLIRDTLAAEYEILEELGRGGMAIVFRAREKALDRLMWIFGALLLILGLRAVAAVVLS